MAWIYQIAFMRRAIWRNEKTFLQYPRARSLWYLSLSKNGFGVGLQQSVSAFFPGQILTILIQNRFGGSLIQYSSKGTLYVYNDGLICRIVRVIITICSAIILIIPIIALHFVQSRTQALIGVALGTTLVALGMALGTDCRDHEVLMAACAYVFDCPIQICHNCWSGIDMAPSWSFLWPLKGRLDLIETLRASRRCWRLSLAISQQEYMTILFPNESKNAKTTKKQAKTKQTTDIVWWWSPGAHESVLGGSLP